MKFFSTNHILLIVAIAANVIAVSAYYFVFQDVKEKNERIYHLEDEILAKNTLIAEDSSLKETLASTVADRSLIASYFVRADDVVRFIETVENLGKPSGTDVEISSVSDDKKDEDYGSLTLAVSSKGSWAGIMNFLSMLENLPYKITIDSTSFDVVSQEKGTQWNLRVTMSVIKSKQ